MQNVICIVLGGGKGTRLFPLTWQRAKPAVPFAGKYRLVDIPISNCINSGFRQIFILTQFNSVSLHTHLSNTYIFDSFSSGFVEILAAEQTFENNSWYEGTADAVRKNFIHFRSRNPSHYVILAGDQLYRMDLRKMFNHHVNSGADLTIACTPVTRTEADQLGIMKTDESTRVVGFHEKPGLKKDISHLKIPDNIREGKNLGEKEYLASMGIYIYSAEAMEKILDNSFTDFGKEIIPLTIETQKVNAFIFDSFWVDVGTIKSFYETNINLGTMTPQFNFYDENMPIYTHKRHLPATKINYCTMSETLTCEGSIITNATITSSIIGIRSVIESGANLEGVIIMGANHYETPLQKEENRKKGIPDIGIGKNTVIKKAIIDKNARIGRDCRIGLNLEHAEDGDYDYCYIREGIVLIPKGMIVPDGTVIA